MLIVLVILRLELEDCVRGVHVNFPLETQNAIVYVVLRLEGLRVLADRVYRSLYLVQHFLVVKCRNENAAGLRTLAAVRGLRQLLSDVVPRAGYVPKLVADVVVQNTFRIGLKIRIVHKVLHRLVEDVSGDNVHVLLKHPERVLKSLLDVLFVQKRGRGRGHKGVE